MSASAPGLRRQRLVRIGSELVHIRPAPGSERVAVRAALVVLCALSCLLLAGRLEWSLYAVFGAFASIYGGGPRAGRWRTQAALGGVLTLAVASGSVVALSPARSWLSIPVAAAWASGAAWASDRFSWRPPGPMFPVFAAAATSAIPTTPSVVAPAILVCALTAAVSVGLGALDSALHLRRPRRSGRAAPPAHSPTARRRRIQIIRCAAVVAVTGTLATAFDIGHPYWAMLTAVVPLAVPGLRAQLVRGIHRGIGTVIGLGVAAVLLAIPLPPFAVVVIGALLQGAAELLVVRNYAGGLIAITPLALVLGHLGAPQPVPELLLARFLETVLGVTVGVVAAVLTRDRAHPS